MHRTIASLLIILAQATLGNCLCSSNANCGDIANYQCNSNGFCVRYTNQLTPTSGNLTEGLLALAVILWMALGVGVYVGGILLIGKYVRVEVAAEAPPRRPEPV